jgi:hypothetical protein
MVAGGAGPVGADAVDHAAHRTFEALVVPAAADAGALHAVPRALDPLLAPFDAADATDAERLATGTKYLLREFLRQNPGE